MTPSRHAGFRSDARSTLTRLALALLAAALAGSVAAADEVRPHLPPIGPISTPAAKADQVERDRIAGVAAFEHGDFATAAAYFKRVRQLDPTNDEGMFLLGRAQLATGDAAGAVDQLSNAIARNDKIEKYYYARAKAEMKLGKYAAAVADYNRDLELRDGKGSPTFFLSRADAYLNNAELDLAVKDYGQAATGDGDIRLAREHRGLALARMGDIAGAIEDLNAAEAIGRAANTLDVDTFFYRGIVEELSGDKVAAEADYKAAAALKGEHAQAARCLADALAGKHYGLFSGPPKQCRNIDAAKALALPPEL